MNPPQHKFQFSVSLELIKIAIKDFLDLRGDSSLDMLMNLLPKKVDLISKLVDVRLVDLINITDFIDMPRLLRYYHRDQVDLCLQLLSQDKLILQELYNQNYYKQKRQSQGEFVTQTQHWYSADFTSQYRDLQAIKDCLESAPKKSYI